MTAVLADTPTTVVTAAGGEAAARWSARAGACAVDVLPAVGVVAAAALAAVTLPPFGPWWWICVSVGGVAMLAIPVNRVILPAVTGWSLGRAAFGVQVVRRGGDPAGPVRLAVRDVAHLLDTLALLLGWFWPLWDPPRRTFADMLMGTRAHAVPCPVATRTMQRRVVALVGVAAVLCAALGGVSFFVVYQRDRANDQARAQLSEQGPKIVAEMLTYDPKTLTDDFAHAQSLTTDNYRGQLIEVQQAVQKGATPHAYWIPDSAVLAAAPRQGTMLMFLQGQAGVPPHVQGIHATLRVQFAKPADRWLIDDLTFVPPPGHR
ncbi:RDD family protein [Mycobacterium sp. pUA109]|uniref:RDD family protein n=1 Tax=Mycobacterium sp. pUA109 TaxID=3238982 RepID=UPI00351B66C7